jgi:C1A family cysteine protease
MTDNENEIFIGGALKSPEDKRDHIAETVMARQRSLKALPEELDLRGDMQDVVNQGSQGTCSAQSASAIREYQEQKEMQLNQYLSPQFVYNLRSNYPGAGMFGRNTMEILLKNGICRELTYAYGTIEPIEDIPSEVYNEAKHHVIQEYARVTTLKGLKESLYRNGPCYISFPVYNYGGRFWKEKEGDKMIGGHAVCVVGYNKEGFILRNSWGKGWVDNGYTVYPYRDWNSHWEIWTVIDADTPDDINYKKKTKCCNII